MSDVNLDGLRVAITGAARDTGRLLAEAFAERGAEVFLSARDPGAARDTAGLINRRGPGQAWGFPCDLAAPCSVREFADAVAGRSGRI